MTALPLLTYSIAPNTVNVSDTDNSSSTYSLQISVANVNSGGISYTINSITFLIPIGNNTGALIPTGKVEKVKSGNTTSGWSIVLSATSNADTSTYASWVLTPQGTAGELADGSQIIATLDEVTINTEPGSAQIYVYEDIVENPLPDNAYAPLGLIVNKLEPTPELLSFGSNDAAILFGENVFLNWNSIGVSQCVLKCSNPVAELNVPAKSTRYQAPTPTRVGLANYVLFGRAHGLTLSQTLHTGVTVFSVPIITSFTAEPGTTAGTLNVSWKTKYTTEVTLTLTGIGTTPPVATFDGLPANGLNTPLSGLSPNWAGTLTLTAIDPDSTEIATQTLTVPADACAPTVSINNYFPIDQNYILRSSNLCSSPDGKKIVGLVNDKTTNNCAAAISSDNGSNWSITYTKKQYPHLPDIISSSSSSYFGVKTPEWDKKILCFYFSSDAINWGEESEHEIPYFPEINKTPIFEFKQNVWFYCKVYSINTVYIYRIDSDYLFKLMSCVQSVSYPVGLSYHGEKFVLITHQSLMTSSDGKTWRTIDKNIPWIENDDIPIAPPISHNGCLWLFASKANISTNGKKYVSLYCQDQTGKWLFWNIPVEEQFRIVDHSVFIANDILQIHGEGTNNSYTCLVVPLTSTPSLPLPHSG